MKHIVWICGCLAMIGTLFIGTAAISLADDKLKVLFDKKFTSPLSAGWYWEMERSALVGYNSERVVRPFFLLWA